MRTFAALHEVRPLPGCEISTREVAGAFVWSVVVAATPASAHTRILARLSASHFEVMSEEWIVDSSDPEWAYLEDPDIQRARRDAIVTGEVVYARFDMWPAH